MEPSFPLSGKRQQSAEAALRTTHWSVVLAAGSNDHADSKSALEELCQCYWIPVYAYIRRQGYPVADAQDLAQDFFVRLLEKGQIGMADPNRGRFRNFLLTVLKHFLADQHDRSVAKKRGGGVRPLSIDEHQAEGNYLAEPVERLTPEKEYERKWVTTLLERVVSRLAEDFARSGTLEFFEELKPFLWGEKAVTPYRDIAARFGMSEGAVKMTVSRLRNRYRDILRAEISHTVESADMVEDEIRYLMKVYDS